MVSWLVGWLDGWMVFVETVTPTFGARRPERMIALVRLASPKRMIALVRLECEVL